MMMRTLWIVVALFAGLSSAQAQYVVGNAGEGILENGELYVRELYERDIKENSVFTGKTLPEIADLVAKSSALPLNAEDKSLLASKLSEIETAWPCGGLLLINAMEKYNWVFTETPLALHPERDAIRHFPESMRVQIANRYYLSINVHIASWNLLNPSHRVALILHELFYGLSVVPPLSDDPPLGQVREVVGTLFSKGIHQGDSVILMIHRMLGLEENNFCAVKPNTAVFRIAAETLEPVKVLKTTSGNLKAPARQLLSLLQNVCASFIRAPHYYTLRVDLSSAQNLRLQFEPYVTSNRNRQYRLAIASRFISDLEYSQRDFRNSGACVKQLSADLSSQYR